MRSISRTAQTAITRGNHGGDVAEAAMYARPSPGLQADERRREAERRHVAHEDGDARLMEAERLGSWSGATSPFLAAVARVPGCAP
jgi:hypothetical protein